MRKGGHNPREDSKKKLRVKRTERKKESGKENRENMAKIGACINKISFPSLFNKPTL